MKWQEWILVLALIMWFISFLSLPLQLFVLFLSIFYHHKRFNSGLLLFLLIIVLFLIRINMVQNQKPESNIYEITEIKSNYCIASQGEIKVIAYGLNDIHLGDVYKLKGSIQEVDGVSNFHCFSFSDWAKRHQYHYSIQVKESTLIHHGKKLSHHLFETVQTKEEPYKSFLFMMLYGIHQDEVSYLMISTGMHLSFLCGLLKWLFKRKRIGDIFCISFLSSIAWITQPSASLWRMFSFSICRFVFYEESTKVRLGISMMITLFLMPYMYCEMSFVLPVGFSLLSSFCIERYPRWIQTIFIMFPIQLIYYHRCSFIQIFSFRILRIFYVFLYVYAWGLLVLPIQFLYPFIDRTMMLLESISFESDALIGSIPTIMLLWYIEALLAMFKSKSFKNIGIYLLCCITIIFQSKWFPFTRVLTLDVGQGDCSVIIEPFAKRVIMIDIMGSLYKNIPEDIVVERLYALGIRKIDLLVLTHEDYDHSGGYEELREYIDVKQVISTKAQAKAYNDSNIKFLLLNYQGKDENDNSIITYYESHLTSFLFMGDLGVTGEKELLTQYPLLKTDVLKVGHHGSRTSSSKAFIHRIQPQLALISAGRNNHYQHPHQDVLFILQNENVALHITKQHGEGDLYITPWGALFINRKHQIYWLK